MPVKVSNETKDEICEMALSGERPEDIAIKFNLRLIYIRKVLKDAGIKVDRRKAFSVEPPRVECVTYPFSRLSPEDQKKI